MNGVVIAPGMLQSSPTVTRAFREMWRVLLHGG